jgi:hypothetical protein
MTPELSHETKNAVVRQGKERLIAHLMNDGILEPNQALELLMLEIGFTPVETEAFIKQIADFYNKIEGKPRWTEWDDANIVTMYEEGYLPKDIAKRLGRTVAAINQRIFRLRQLGHSLPSRRPRMIGNSYAHKEVS